jgi:hypothetical protein
MRWRPVWQSRQSPNDASACQTTTALGGSLCESLELECVRVGEVRLSRRCPALLIPDCAVVCPTKPLQQIRAHPRVARLKCWWRVKGGFPPRIQTARLFPLTHMASRYSESKSA